MLVNKRILVFLSLGLLSFTLERRVKTACKETFITTTISLLHNFGSIYLIFGSLLFGYYIFHLLCIIIVVFLWKLLGICIITQYYNNLCKISKNRPFHDIFYLTNKKLKIPYFSYILAFCVALYDIKKISESDIM